MKMIVSAAAALATVTLVSACSSARLASESTINSVTTGGTHANDVSLRPATATIPSAQIYKMNGDYADLVPVTLNTKRDGLVSFPAPSDLSGGAPVKLADGFLLDRRGINAMTAFTRWTYAEYSTLPTAPSAKEIMENLLPEAKITEIYSMPFAAGTPDAKSLCDSLISAGLPGCKLIYSMPRITLQE